MANYIAAMGKAGTLRSLADAIRERRARKEKEGLLEEQRQLEEVRVPVSAPKQAPERATEAPIAEAMKQNYEKTKQDIERETEEMVRSVDELPVMQQLAPFPTAQNRLMQIAQANGWLKEIGGVQTISNKQMKIAQGIIAGDLDLRKNINELALGDVTQQIGELKQSLLDPKLKDEERAGIQEQIQNLTGQQDNFLNAINMMDREIQRRKAIPKTPKEAAPNEKLYTNKKGELRYVNIRDTEAVRKAEEEGYFPWTKKEKGKGNGADLKEYRQWLKQGEGNAYRDIFINKPGLLDDIEAMEAEEDPERKALLEAKLHQQMNTEQRKRFDELVKQYMESESPDPILAEFRKIKKRTPTKKPTQEDPLGLR